MENIPIFGHHLTACDAKHNFTLIDIGAYGSQSDGDVFRESIFGQAIDQDQMNIPPPAPLLESERSEQAIGNQKDSDLCTLFKQPIAQPFPQMQYQCIYETIEEYLSCRQSAKLPEHILLALHEYRSLIQQWLNNPKCWTPESSKYDIVSQLNDNVVESSIQKVLEFLPSLGTGFVLKCLEQMNYNPEEVVSKILDENLPPDLIEIPRDLMQADVVNNPTMPGPSGILPKVTAHTGKRSYYRDANEMLNDKGEKEILKDLVLKSTYSYGSDEEFDDRVEIYNHLEIDSDNSISELNIDEVKGQHNFVKQKLKSKHQAKKLSSSSEDEAMSSKRFWENKTSAKPSSSKKNPFQNMFVTNKVYDALKEHWERNNSRNSRTSDSVYQEPTENGDEPTKPRDAFCENPEIIRARRDAHFRQNQRNFNSNAAGNSKGESKDNVLKNRSNKNVHKSSRANHNRKSGAQWKRNKGMIPS